MTKNLFSSATVGAIETPNRIFMAPLTRSRALQDGLIPNPLAEIYYEQRTSAGLIITEGSQVSQQGQGYITTPGIYSTAQVEGWKKITEKVHAKGSKIFLQLWHVGRVSHPEFQNGGLPVAPSAIGIDGDIFTHDGRKKMVIPRALEGSEISEVIEQFRLGALNAKIAGFDGVEIHGANGYLPEQFINDSSNKRTDEYGGSIENRARFILDITRAAMDSFGRDRVGVRVSPNNRFNSAGDSNPTLIYRHIVKELSHMGIAYLHVVEGVEGSRMAPPENLSRVGPALREAFNGFFIANGGYGLDTGNAALLSGYADAVAFGVPFLANPDLPARFRINAPLNQPDPTSFYGGAEKGYIDYPFLKAQK